MSTLTLTTTMSGYDRSSEQSSGPGFQVIIERPDQPTVTPPTGEPAFRPRRYHTKSRNGCFNCKRRRIKCDEAAPECSHCWEKGLQCEYPPTKPSPQIRTPSLPSPVRQPSRSRKSSEDLGLSDPRMQAMLDEDDVPCDSVIQQGYRRSDVFDLLHQFVVPTERPWIGSSYAQGMMQEHVRRYAASTPYLLYSALAFSAAHMHYLHPTDNKYRVAAPYHYQHSLQKYFEKLSEDLEGDDADSLVVACKLHAYLAFLNASSAHNGRPGIDLGWIRSMRGIRFITEAPDLLASLQSGGFSPVARLTAHDWREICGHEQRDSGPRVAVDMRQLQALERLCAGLHPEYQATLSYTIGMLRDLAQIKPDPALIDHFMIWINRQSTTFVDLLQIAEPVALLTIGVWCSLFSRIDEWWIVEPAKAECRRICDYVDSLRDSRLSSVVAHLRMVTQ